MRIDGKLIAEAVKVQVTADLKRLPKMPTLAILVSQETPVIRTFINIKKKVAETLGVPMVEYGHNALANEGDFLHQLLDAAHKHDGIVVQLPLSPHLSIESVRNILPITHDVDVLGTTAYGQFSENRLPILPPVSGAIDAILRHHQMTLRGKNVVVIGAGLLVGAPSARYATRMGAASVTVVTDTKGSLAEALLNADVIISGAGVPGLVKPEMIKDGVLIFDAGTSESGGKVVGDEDPLCETKAALFTPTPGGIGPVTVAMIFHNLVHLTALRQGVALDGILSE